MHSFLYVRCIKSLNKANKQHRKRSNKQVTSENVICFYYWKIGGLDMGIIYNSNVEETKILQSYGLTVYGKINRYVWTMDNNKEEKALITIRIEDTEGKNIFSMNMGNRFIFQSRIDDTMDNFLYWIAEEQPDIYTIERQVYKSLCASDAFFNHSIRQKKENQKREEAEKIRIAELKKEEDAAIQSIKTYCAKNGLIPHFTYNGVYLIKTRTENALQMLKMADDKHMESIIKFIKKYPDNKDASIFKFGTREEILQYIA